MVKAKHNFMRSVWLFGLTTTILLLVVMAMPGIAPAYANVPRQDNMTATALQATIFKLQTSMPSSDEATQETSALPVEKGKVAVVTAEGDELYVLDAPEAGSTRLAVLVKGDHVMVKAGPETTDGYEWWQVQLADGHSGWVVGQSNGVQWLAGSDDSTTVEAPGDLGISYVFLGARVSMSPNTPKRLAIRDTPSIQGQVLRYLDVVQDTINREVLLVVGGPVNADGFRWWQVRYSKDASYQQFGWIAEAAQGINYLDIQYPVAKAANVRGGHFSIGDKVRVTSSGDGLKLRSKASRTSPAVTTIGQGVTATVVDGPVETDIDVWWKIQRSDGQQGWVATLPGWLEVYQEK